MTTNGFKHTFLKQRSTYAIPLENFFTVGISVPIRVPVPVHISVQEQVNHVKVSIQVSFSTTNSATVILFGT